MLFVGFAATVHAQEPAAQERSFWLWDFMGRLHPLAVHFPVSLLLIAAILELFTWKKFHSSLRPGINVLAFTGAISAVVSAVLGWLLSRGGDYSEESFDIHKWTGIATAILGAAAAVVLLIVVRRKRIRLAGTYRLLLILSTIGVGVAGHFGASVTHGDDYLTSTLPGHEPEGGGENVHIDFASLKADSSKLSSQQSMQLTGEVRGIFAHNCYKCHGSAKVKGELRLDKKEFVFKGGESGALFVAGDPQHSELVRRISLPAGHEDVMPSKGKRLSDKEVLTISRWIQKGAPWPDNLKEEPAFKTASLAPRTPALPADASGKLSNPVDLFVNDYFRKKKIKWPEVVDDHVYLRRIYLDIIGLLPKPEEYSAFAKDPRPDKRSIWAQQLLNRPDDYAAHWLTFWNDALRNDYTGTGYITGGRYDISNWLYTSLRDDKPYNLFVEQLIAPNDSSKGFIEGIKWRGVVNASQRTEMQAAQNVAQVFYGLNIKCASCHNSFINNWKLEDAYAFANIFADSSLEINRCDKPTGDYTQARMLFKELGAIESKATKETKQEQLAKYMTSPANGRLYRTIVNRLWAQFMGHGLIEPVDVMDNEPWSQDLLDWMAVNFVKEQYDIKKLIHLIITSKAYQLPSVGVKDPSQLTAQDFVFTGMVKRRMSAEQFADAVSSVVQPLFPDSLVKFHAPNAEYAFNRASFVVNNPFLSALGRPNRETVSTSRESQANLLQALELTKGRRLHEALQEGAQQWSQQYPNGEQLTRQLYKRALGREPNAKELKKIVSVIGEKPQPQDVEDLLWAVLLLPEFQLIY